MHKSKALLIIMFGMVVVSFSHAANILYVDVNSPNDPGSGMFEDPFRKIQDAIDDGNDGDIVEIRPGLYTGQRNYDLDPNASLMSEFDRVEHILQNPSESAVVRILHGFQINLHRR